MNGLPRLMKGEKVKVVKKGSKDFGSIGIVTTSEYKPVGSLPLLRVQLPQHPRDSLFVADEVERIDDVKTSN